MSVMPPITVAVYLIIFVYTVNSFQVSQIQFRFWFKGTISCGWILDKREDSHFLTCSQLCWRNSKCYGIALGPLKENKADNRRDCYVLQTVDLFKQYCTIGDYDEEAVEFYGVSLWFHVLIHC